jgi:hypothetical protein
MAASTDGGATFTDYPVYINPAAGATQSRRTCRRARLFSASRGGLAPAPEPALQQATPRRI